MKSTLEKIIRLRNPDFSFDPQLSTKVILSFFWVQMGGIIRGFKLLLYGKIPKMTLLGKRVSFFNLSSIQFGKYLKVGNDVNFSALGKRGIQIGNNVSIGAFSRLVVSTTLNNLGAFIKIGHNVGIGEFAYLGGAGGLKIGDDCIIGQYFSCHPENHEYEDIVTKIRQQGTKRQGITIGNNCWIGSKVTILDGVTIGEGSVIAAGAVVKSSFPPYSVIGGVPAKILKSRFPIKDQLRFLHNS
ncbi:MAG: acyltransferase [Cecembia sp.]